MKRLSITLLTLTLITTGCATSGMKLPQATNTPVRINNAEETQEILRNSMVLIGPKAQDKATMEMFMSDPFRLMTRQPNPDDFERLGAALVETTVTVTFPSSSTEFKPTGSQQFHLMQLVALATRVEIRGRTSNEVSTPESVWYATERAEAAKRYLIDRGVPGSAIALSVMGAGDPVADNRTAAGRAKNQRVEIQIYVEGKSFDPVERRAVVTTKNISVPTECGHDEWQTVGGTLSADGCVK